jgi:PAS domain S-box-containing protein
VAHERAVDDEHMSYQPSGPGGPPPFGMFALSLAAGRPNAYLAVDDEYCALTGYSRQELSGADFLGDIHPEDEPSVEFLVEKVLSGEMRHFQACVRLVGKCGDIMWARLTGSVIEPSAGEPYLAVHAEDASAARQPEAEMERMERELHRLRRLDSLRQLINGIAHDFNNMLTVIANCASLVRDEITVAETTESASRWGPVRWDVQQLEDAAERARRLIKQLLAFASREQAEPVPVDLGQLIGDATRLLREVLGEHVAVVTRPTAALWPVEIDPGLIEQAITSIALNARDAMPSGGQLVIDTANIDTAHLGTETDRQDTPELADLFPGQYVEMRITDTGTGMDPLTAQRAFEPFFTTKPADRAAGLGLPTVGRIAAQAGGKAWLRSRPGAGTTVTVVLPAAPGSAAAGQAAAQVGGMPGHAGTVLVVDDEPAIRDVAHRVLTSAGYQVTTTADGQEALALLADPGAAVDLLLTDVVMPGMSGSVFAARARDLRPGLRVLYMSGYEQPGAPDGGWPQAEPVIAKPFTRAALLARVSQALTPASA